MPRLPRPWFRSDRNMYFGSSAGKQFPLGVPGPASPEAYASAEHALRQLLGRRAPEPTPLPPDSVSAATAEFIRRCEQRAASGRLGPRTLGHYRIFAAHLVAAFGPRPFASLAPDELEQWADRPGWSASYQNGVLGFVLMVAKFLRHPLRLRRPPKESRGAAVVLSDDQFRLVLSKLYVRGGTPGDLLELLTVLRETGARPGEVAGLAVGGVDWANCCAVLRTHKTRRQTGRDRLIVFTAAAMAVLHKQRDRYGSGPLFRTRGGRKVYGPNVIVKQLLKVSKRVGFRVTAYGLGRHSFCTHALVSGVPEAVVAALVGHSGTGMLARHYSHVGSQANVLRDAAERVSRGASP